MNSSEHIVQAWKDPEYRESVGMTAHPSGDIELYVGAGDAAAMSVSVTTDCWLWSVATTITEVMSWNGGACNHSFANGTCNFYGYGC